MAHPVDRRPLGKSLRCRWMAFPLAVFLVSRILLFGLAYFGTLFGRPLGPARDEQPGFVAGSPTLAGIGHGDVTVLARIARSDPAAAEDARSFPLLPALGKLALALGHSPEAWLIAVSSLACGAAYVAVYRLYLDSAGPTVARAALGLMAAFPFAFRLSDGGALGALAFFTSLGTLLARRGSAVWASAAVSLGALAHPAAIAATAALVCYGPLAPGRRLARPLSRLVYWAVAMCPLAVAGAWLLHLATTRRVPISALVPPFALPSTPVVMACLPFAVLVLAGATLAVARGPAALGVSTGLQAALLVIGGGFAGTRALGACWGAFLPLAQGLERRPAAQGLALVGLATYQGLFYYLFVHRFPFA